MCILSPTTHTSTYVLTPRDTEHIWHLYNIIEVDDLVGGRTYRKVQAANDTGTASNSRVAIDISVRVEKTDVDLEAGVVRVNGRNVTMSEHLKLGAYHTMELVINQTYRIHKAEWDSMNRERALKIRFLTSDGGDTTAVVMQEGLANICIVKESLTLIRQRIEMPIPRKRKGETAQHERGLQQFFEAVLEGIVRHIDLAAMRCLVLASPGFVKDKFLEHVKAAADADNKSAKMILEHRRKIELAHSASGHTNALAELLTGANAKSGGGMLSNTAMADELAAMQQFYTMLRVQPDKAFYGETHVRRAAAENAIETLLVSDSLFR